MLNKNKINLLFGAIMLLVMPCLVLFAGCDNEIKQRTNNEYNINYVMLLCSLQSQINLLTQIRYK